MQKASLTRRKSSTEKKTHSVNPAGRVSNVSKPSCTRESNRASASRKRAIDYFAAGSFREGQKEAIEAIQTAFDEGYKYVLLDAPTGVGKSRIAQSFASFFGSTHIVTPQKILQMQYKRDFEKEMFIMMGRGAYQCLQTPDETCAKGICRRQKGIRHDGCPYRVALERATLAPITVHNFDSFYFQTKYARAFDQRSLLIIDECHNLESKALNFMEFTISNKNNKQLVIPNLQRIGDYDFFLEDFRERANKRVVELDAYVDEGLDILTAEQLAEHDDLAELVGRIDHYFFSREKYGEYVFEYVPKDDYASVTFKPVFIGGFLKENILPMGEKVLMMSATILDKELFCESIGLDAEEVAYVGVDSTFPIENRPIRKRYIGGMGFKRIEGTLPKLIPAIKAILAQHPGERGIIHTVSNKIDDYIKRNCHDSRLTFRSSFRTVDDLLIAHTKKKDSFIVAAGLKEGLDLSGDLSRVQIIVKVPFPSLGDKRVARRKELKPAWYGYMTVLMFIQSLGRSIRSKDDFAVTYILDSDFDFFYNMNKSFIPKYVRKAFVKEY